MYFTDRLEAGRRLAEQLGFLAGEDAVIVGLPRGGVPVASEVARVLGLPLDVIVVRKLGVPFQPELGMGALGEGGVRVLNESVMRAARVSASELAEVELRERAELERRARRFRGDRAPVPLAGRTAVVVDDGIATGSTVRAACQVARAQGATRVVLAAPVAPAGAAQELGEVADAVICLYSPADFFSISQFYADFRQVDDEEVVDLLGRADGPPGDRLVRVPAGGVELAGQLTVPPDAHGVVVFAHGSGSSRLSPRNGYVASRMNNAGLGTLLFDLLTVEEEADRANVFDIDLLARRLLEVTAWLRAEAGLREAPIGYFGASTGAGAALAAAADPAADVRAVVSRGGRPDLAGPRLAFVRAPTLLIVGGADPAVLDLNEGARRLLRCENRLAVVPGATHLFEEPGTLDQVAGLATDWFAGHLSSIVPTPSRRDVRP